MLKINKKLRIPLGLFGVSLGGVFLFQYLTFIPEYSSAEEISTTNPVVLPKIEGTITTKFGTEEQGYKTYMQEIDLNYCQSLPNETTGQLADGRDGKIYWVTKLAGTCWMTQDLDLDLGPNGPVLTTANDGANLYKGSATSWTGGKSVTSSSSGWPKSNGNPTQNINWYERDKTHGTDYTSLGNLYSYEAATAGTGHNVTGNNQEVSGSICPAGWGLPLSGNATASTLGSFNSLVKAGMTDNTLANSSPYYFQHGGFIAGSLEHVGVGGNYWSATSRSGDFAYRLAFLIYFGFFSIDESNNRYYGQSVRCVVRDASYTPPVVSLSNPNVSVMVDRVLTLEITDEEVNTEPEYSKIATGNFTATVSSNTGYDISLSATEGGHTAMIDNKSATFNIPTTNNVEVGTNGWGIKCIDDNDNCVIKSYNALTLYNNPRVYFSSTNAVANKPTHFEVGIGISSSLPSGTYSTNILVTASQK